MFSFLEMVTYVGGFLAIFVIIPASFGRELGMRRLYIRLLMKAFAWGTNKIKIEEKKRNRSFSANSPEIIEKQNSINRIGSLGENMNKYQKDFHLEDVCYLVKSGIEAVIDDEVTKRFTAEELPSWNLLTRSNLNYQYISLRLTVLWVGGLIIRYLILFPLRVFVTGFTLTSLAVCASTVAHLPDNKFKRDLVYHMNVVAFRMMCRGISAIITYHDRENLPRSGGICVANHTTVIDAVVLMQDRPYAILGQKHSGFLGWCMDTISKSAKHVWFERSESSDRKFVARRMMEHVSDDKNYPILLFPEGTCINNTSVMMFKKGSFELPTTVYPVAIKYNPWFGDAYWNSSKHSMLQYLVKVMTSWALVADVWYLPAMNKREDEDAIHFADRVKKEIARRGGLVDSVWDGQLKRMRVKQQYVEEKQKELSDFFLLRQNHLKKTSSPSCEEEEEELLMQQQVIREELEQEIANDKNNLDAGGAEGESELETADGIHMQDVDDVTKVVTIGKVMKLTNKEARADSSSSDDDGIVVLQLNGVDDATCDDEAACDEVVMTSNGHEKAELVNGHHDDADDKSR